MATVILFCLFYSRIQAASQSKKGLYFPNFGEFFPNLQILLGFIPNFKRQRLYPEKGNKITGPYIAIFFWSHCPYLKKRAPPLWLSK